MDESGVPINLHLLWKMVAESLLSGAPSDFFPRNMKSKLEQPHHVPPQNSAKVDFQGPAPRKRGPHAISSSQQNIYILISPPLSFSEKKNGIIFAKTFLVGGFNPFQKYVRQNGSFPQIGVKI